LLGFLPRVLEIETDFKWVELVQPRLMPQLLGTVHLLLVAFSKKKQQEDTSLKLCESSFLRDGLHGNHADSFLAV
jgi:hypothetical protein